MKAEHSTEADINVFRKWSSSDRLEEMTCRPVVNGKRIPRSNDVKFLSFFIDEYKNPVGKFSYFDINERNRSCEFGYVIDPEHRNRGFGKKMIMTCIDFLFKNSNLNKLYCQTASFNVPSVKLLESTGFRRDAVLRQHHELDGKLWDDYVYSILRSEWENKMASFPTDKF